uniref:Uncharacterized protein n=1 Tax=Strongyloides venezuelensis TaxID=75913 RepID=A0A0K0FXG6_STRVS
MLNLFNFNNSSKKEEKKSIRRVTSLNKPLDKKNQKNLPPSEKKTHNQQTGEKKHLSINDGGEKISERKIRSKKEDFTETKNKCSSTRQEQIDKGTESLFNLFIDNLQPKTLNDLKIVYAGIKSHVFSEHTRIAFDNNMPLNKYKDIVCIDETRVILDPPGSNYYHANFVTQPGMKHNFICCQAPMNETIADFWRLCIQQNVSIIICLVNLIENGKQKCSQYWPTNEGEKIKIKCFNVQYESTDYCDDAFFIRNLKIWTDGDDVTAVKIRQFQWKDWPDKCVPSDTTSIMRLIKRLKDIKKEETIVVHCSAGIGRTGTLVAAYILFSRISSKTFINIYDTVISIRKQRAGAVQTEIQYIYLHKVIIDYCLIINALNAPRMAIAIKFVEEYNAYYETLLHGGLQ